MHHIQSNNLKMLRKKFGYTQKQMATLLGCNSQVTYCRYETGKRALPIQQLIALEALAGASLKTIYPSAYQAITDQVAARLEHLR